MQVELKVNGKTVHAEISEEQAKILGLVEDTPKTGYERGKMTKEQLCWTCQKACGDCSWSSCFQPVEGWTAEKVHRKTYDSYRIEKCPEYVPDKK